MKKIIITFSIILFLFLSYIIFSVLGFLSLIPSNISESDDITYYNELVERVEYFPNIEELNDYKNLSFKYTLDDSLFGRRSYILKVMYSDEDFEIEKEKINEQYSFDEKYSDEIFIDSFKIKVLDIDRYSLKYPKYLAFVGVSESTGEIVYIYFESEDLDTIGDSWEDFIKHECNW